MDPTSPASTGVFNPAPAMQQMFNEQNKVSMDMYMVQNDQKKFDNLIQSLNEQSGNMAV